jgi:hypothetical protein
VSVGLGYDPAGSAPLGLYLAPTPVVAAPRAVPAAALVGRAIDPVTGDYLLDAYGRPVLVSGVRQRVLLAVGTTLGSAAATFMGQDLGTLRDITPDIDRLVDSAYRRALARLVASGEVEIVSLDVVTFGPDGSNQENSASIRLRWRDLSAAGLPSYDEVSPLHG